MKHGVTGLLIALVMLLSHSASAQDVPIPQLPLRMMAQGPLEAGQQLEFDAYVSSESELKLYHSQSAAELGLVYPYCISANAHGMDLPERRAFNAKWVRVFGTLLEEDDRNLRPSHLRGHAEADGLSFGNFCYGPLLLRIDSIEELEPDLYTRRDCVPRSFAVCIPLEWDQYWTYINGPTVRLPSPSLDGPVTIGVGAQDALFHSSVADLLRKRVGDFVVFHRFDCERETICVLTYGTAAQYGVDAALEDGLILREIKIETEDGDTMQEALDRLYFCPVYGCASGPSITFASLRSR